VVSLLSILYADKPVKEKMDLRTPLAIKVKLNSSRINLEAR